jgi:ABC-type uncharacterized transport system involved in gliding motility auxiliary subunit
MLNRLFGALGWFGSILVFTAVVVWFVRPDLGQLRQVLAFAGLASILLYGAGQWRHVQRSFKRRQTRYGTLASTSVVLVFAIVVALNYVLARQNKRWDLTAAQQYSLSDQTRRVLDSLTAPIRIIVFDREPNFPRYRDRLDEYAYQSSLVTIDYIDVDKQPLLARHYEVQSYGTIVFDYAGRVERVLSDAEQDLTNGLIKVVEGEEQTVYFLRGHGEKEHTDSEGDGYSTVTAALGLDNFEVESLVLAQQSGVPKDATVLIVAGPRTDLLPGEVEALRVYLDRGGKLLVLIDPPSDSEAQEPDGLLGLLREWGIEPGTDVVVDSSGLGQFIGADASVPVVASYPFHPITDRFNLLTAYPLVRSVSATTGTTDGRVPQPFLETSAQSWAETDIDELLTGRVELNEEAGDRPGPVTIGMAVSAPAPSVESTGPDVVTQADEPGGENDDTNPEDEAADASRPETRLVVVGDSDFATNGVVGVEGNRDMFLNAVNWLAQQENLISIRAREPEDRRLTLTADAQRRLFWLSLLLIPGFVFGTGLYTWARRR